MSESKKNPEIGVAAREFHKGFAAALIMLGWSVENESPVDYVRKEGTVCGGRIDILAQKDGKTLAVELDSRHPRQKSIKKMQSVTADEKWIILRSGTMLRVDSLKTESMYSDNRETEAGEKKSKLAKVDASQSALAIHIYALISEAVGLSMFLNLLERDGIDVEPNIATSTDRLYGFRFTKDGESLTGAIIGLTPDTLNRWGLEYKPHEHAQKLRNLRKKAMQKRNGKLYSS